MNIAKNLYSAAAPLLAALCLSSALTNNAHAESVSVPVPIGQQAQSKQHIAKPRSGMSKSQVEAQYGSPRQIVAPVGEPPISSWVYPDYVVYFEYNHVIHSVLKYTPASQ